MKTRRLVLLLAWALSGAAFGAESGQDGHTRSVRARQQAIAAKQQQLLELSEQLVQRLEDLARATETLRQLERRRRGPLSGHSIALLAAEDLRTELLAEERRAAAKRIAAQAKSDVDVQRPNQGGVITIGERVIVIPPRPAQETNPQAAGPPQAP